MPKKFPAGTVYIVDDDAAVRQAVALILSRSDFQTIAFPDGESLMQIVRRKPPHCIILDLQLPGMSGLEILQQLRIENHSTPVLMMSGKGSIAEAVAALKLGADDFIQKPFTGVELAALVVACIARHAAPAAPKSKAPYLPGKQPLTRRERQVMEHCLKGATAKETAIALGLSPRTVEEHRTGLMRKLGARNIPDLVRIVLADSALTAASLPSG